MDKSHLTEVILINIYFTGKVNGYTMLCFSTISAKCGSFYGFLPLFALVLEIRKGNRVNFGIIFHITPLKHTLRLISTRWFK